jgi:hypothetical protein
MNELKKRFVNQLLAADPPSSDARGRYEKEVQAMLEKTFTPRQRGLYLVGALLFGLLGVLYSFTGLEILVTAAVKPASRREPAFLFLVTCVLATGFALLFVAGRLFLAYWKGVQSQRTAPGRAAVVGVAYVGLLGCLFLLMARHIEMLQDEVRIVGLVLLVYAAVAWVRHRVAQGELRTAEKLLEIELRLAEIGEALNVEPRSTDTQPPTQPPPP